MHRPWWKLRRFGGPARGLGSALFLVGLFLTLDAINRFLCVNAYQTTAFWPANGALVVAILILPARWCVCALVLCFCIDVSLELYTSVTLFDSCLYALLTDLASFMVALLTQRFCGAASDLTRFHRLASFGCIVFLAAGIEAAIGEALSGGTLVDHINAWLQWTLCDGFGFLLAASATLVALNRRGSEAASRTGLVERCSLLIFTAVLTTAAFLFVKSPLFLLIYPLLILTAFRSGPRWVLASILITAIISSALTAHGFGPLAFLSNGDFLLGQGLIQPFLLSIFLTAAPANNALGEKVSRGAASFADESGDRAYGNA